MAGKWGRSALHSVEQLDGVGPKRAKQLEEIGLGTIEELASLDRSALGGGASIIDGLTERDLSESLLPQACFHLLGADGAAAASDLVGDGIDTYVRLFAAPPNRLVNLLGDDWKLDRVLQLQLAAARTALCFQVLLQVLDRDDQPLAPRLQVAGAGFDSARHVVTREGDAEGWVLSPYLRRDRLHHLNIVAGSQNRSRFVRATRSQVSRSVLRFRRDPSGWDESTLPPRARILSGHETLIIEETPLPDVPTGTPMRVVRVENGVVSLVGLHRRLFGNTVVVPGVEVNATPMLSDMLPGDVVVKDPSGDVRPTQPSERSAVLAARGEGLFEEVF